jgi:formate hydrogenlyase transcriptional activator
MHTLQPLNGRHGASTSADAPTLGWRAAIVEDSPAMKRILAAVALVAPMPSTVLIEGETGTGKELVARAIHDASPRRDKPFVTADCASLPATLIDSELFGYEPGGFTGAARTHVGRFERASGGTLFIDEVGELPIGMQPKLLRALQQRQIDRIGGCQPVSVDIRVVAATNRDLRAMVARGQFRADLYYRLNVFPLRIPPLRARIEELPALAEYFLAKHARRATRPARSLSPAAIERLVRHSWPGNVRELENVVVRAAILSGDAEYVEVEAAMRDVARPARKQALALRDVERRHIEHILERCRGRIEGVGGAAAVLELKPSTLRSRMHKLGISR